MSSHTDCLKTPTASKIEDDTACIKVVTETCCGERSTSVIKAKESKTLAENISLVCNDGSVINLSSDVASTSRLLTSTLNTVQDGLKPQRIKLPFRKDVVRKAVDYMEYKRTWEGNAAVAPKFTVEDDIAAETLLAADYLQL